jgi:hypothetical protein
MKVKEMVTENLGLKALSLFLAVVLWLFVVLGMEGEADFTVPVRFMNLSPRFSVEKQTPTIELRVAGPKFLLMRLDRARLTASLDLAGVGEGSVVYHNLERAVSLPSGLRIVRVYPADLGLTVTGKTNQTERPSRP